jgi:hypothetical protein
VNGRLWPIPGIPFGSCKLTLIGAALESKISLLVQPLAHGPGHFEKTGIASTARRFGQDNVAHLFWKVLYRHPRSRFERLAVMQTPDMTIDHSTLRRRVEAGAHVSG